MMTQEITAEVTKGHSRRHTWAEFQECGLLWLINTTLHVFGWVIVISNDPETGDFVDAYPCRTSWRGFPTRSNEGGHERVAEYLAAASPALLAEASEAEE